MIIGNQLVREKDSVHIRLTGETIDEAIHLFNKYQTAGPIKAGCSFRDDLWPTTDDYSTVTLSFAIPLNQYNNNLFPVVKLQVQDFICLLKAFVLSLFGKYVLVSIQCFLADIRHITTIPPEQIYGSNKDLHLSHPLLVSEFISFVTDVESDSIICDDIQSYIAGIESSADFEYSRHCGKRMLSTFDSYLLFDDLLRDFWRSNLSNEVRLYYFPLYLWWTITAVIPLRPREFLLTPRDCLVSDGNDTYLKIRRSKLKGCRKREVTYKISGDYDINIIKIPESLTMSIEQYMAMTKDYNNNDIDTLFVCPCHYR